MSEGAIVFAIWGSVCIATVITTGVGLVIYFDRKDDRRDAAMAEAGVFTVPVNDVAAAVSSIRKHYTREDLMEEWQ